MPVKRDGLIVAVLWAALTVLGEVLLWNIRMFPPEDAREAGIADDAFRVLLRLSIPVFALVLVMLVYSVLRYRIRGTPREAGAPLWGSRRVYVPWLAVTGALAILLIVNPGLTGLADIRGEQRADLRVQMTASQWSWLVSYPDYGGVSSLDEMVLPVGKRVRFEVTSTDVLHSFWIPAFRIKIDAVPGRTTVVYATTTRTDSYAQDFNLRVQCAELCGLGHASMNLPVRIVGDSEFEQWVTALAEEKG